MIANIDPFHEYDSQGAKLDALVDEVASLRKMVELLTETVTMLAQVENHRIERIRKK